MFYLYQMPVPRLAPDDPRCVAIASRVARLVCIGSEFDDLRLRRELLGDVNAPVATNQAERKLLQSEIDGLVAHLYGLSEEVFVHVLSTFPLVDQSIKDAALNAYRNFALAPADLTLAEMISKGETDGVEFKVAACWNAKENKKDDRMKDNIIQEVAAFLNSQQGGHILIGVKDDKTIVGLEDDYKAANPRKQNRDGYQLFLADALANNLDVNWSLFCKISFGTNGSKDICIIEVTPANEPVYLKSGDFYVREGARMRKYSSKETMKYIKERWR